MDLDGFPAFFFPCQISVDVRLQINYQVGNPERASSPRFETEQNESEQEFGTSEFKKLYFQKDTNFIVIYNLKPPGF